MNWCIGLIIPLQVLDFTFPVIKSLFSSCSPICLACWDSSGCQHDRLMYQPFTPVLWCLQREWLRQHSAPHTTSWMKWLKSIVSCINHRGYFLVTGLQLQVGLLVIALWTCHSRQYSIHFTLHLSSPFFHVSCSYINLSQSSLILTS